MNQAHKKKRRMTRQRAVVFEELRKVKTHPTAEELYAMAKKRMPKLSLATVYRNLETLAEQGLVRKIDIPGESRRWDGDTSDHGHIRCLVCGRVDDLPRPPKLRIERGKKSLKGFELTGIHLELQGICPACQARSKNIKRNGGSLKKALKKA